MSIRDARPEDAAEVAVLLGELGYPGTPELTARNIQRFLDGPGFRLQVAHGADGVVGLVATHVVPRLDNDQITCRITDIVVASAHRRSGVGTILLQGAVKHAREVGAPRLDLSSGEWRADAHAFYLAHGFETRSRGFTKHLRVDAQTVGD